MKPGYKQTEVGVIPEEWEVKPLGAFVSYTNGKAHEQSISDSGLFVVVNSKFISTEGLTRKYSQHSFCPASTGDVLMVMSDVPNGRAIAKCYWVEIDNTYTVNQRICILNPRGIDGKLLFYKLDRNPFYLAFDDGAKQTNLRKDDVLACPLGIPKSDAEQRAIATALSDVDGLLGGLDRLIAKKRDLKQAAMQQLLTGQTRLPGFQGEWVVKRLDQFAPLQRGFDLPTSQISQGDYPVVYSNGVQNRNAKFMVKSPGVVTGRSGTIGNVHFVDEHFWPHNTALWVTDFKNNDPKFVFYFLTSVGLERFGTGSGVPTLNRNDVHEFRVSVPGKSAEQTAIAEVLTEMDAELAGLEQRREKTRTLKQGMMQELLTGRTRMV